jgi:lipopolysaccharide transport system ATP-binding protein
MATPAIQVEQLGKRYRLGLRAATRQTLGEVIVSTLTAPWRRLRSLSDAREGNDAFWALRDVSFEVAPGEVVGIIGANGAGKSTLLKLLSRITEPTTGRAVLRGSVRSLLEVGTGFHPELTGRENIYLNGAILGMKKAEIDRQFEAIVEFAEIARFLDTPVKRYSSGMYVRLAFAVAAHLQPDILIIDEVLAVGDASFQRKCLGAMRDVAGQGRTVLFVSHNMAAISRLCQRLLVLERGALVHVGDVRSGIERYLAPTQTAVCQEPDLNRLRPGWAAPLIQSVAVRAARGEATQVFPLGADLEFELRFECGDRRPVDEPVMGVVINRDDVGAVANVNMRMTGDTPAVGPYRQGTLRCVLPAAPFLQGEYTADIWLADGFRDVDVVHGAVQFRIVDGDVYGTGALPTPHIGMVYLRPRWDVDLGEAPPAAARLVRLVEQAQEAAG